MSSSFSSLTHRDRLLLYCRLCGRRSVAQSSAGVLRPAELFADLIRRLHPDSADAAALAAGAENKDIFPENVCEECEKRLVDADAGGGPSLVDRIRKAAKANDEFALNNLSCEMPLADFWVHSASDGCQICDDDDFFGGADAVAAEVRRVRGFVVADDLSGSRAQVAAGKVPLIRSVSGLPVKTKAEVAAQMFRQMAEHRLLDLVGELRSYGVSFQDKAKEPTSHDVVRICKK